MDTAWLGMVGVALFLQTCLNLWQEYRICCLRVDIDSLRRLVLNK